MANRRESVLSIKLDWLVESDVGNTEIAEDAVAAAARRRRQQRLWRGITAGIVIAAVIAGGGWWRLRQVDQQRRAMLEGVVTSEALALRLSDRDAFMRRQGPAEDWRDRQRDSFDDFQRIGTQVVVTGDILTAEMSGDDARVRVRVMVADQPDEAVWVYRYTAERGWRHVGTEYEPWSMEQGQAADWLTITHYPADQAWADTLEDLVTDWSAQAADVSGMNPPHLKIEIDPQAASAHWSSTDASLLIVPPRPMDGTPLRPGEIARLADLLAEHWTRHATGQAEFNEYDQWAAAEVTEWYRRQFDSSASAPRILTPLIHAFGPNLMPSFLREMRRGTRVGTTALRSAMQESAPQLLSEREMEQYLSSYLYAEAIFIQQEAGRSFEPDWRATTIFLDPERLLRDTPRIYDDTWLLRVLPYSVQVVDAELHRGILWARTEILLDQRWWARFPSDYQPAVIYVPFRKVNGAWMHTRPRAEDWGALMREAGDTLTVAYYELDAPFAAGMQPHLEQIYRRAAADVGYEHAPRAVLTVHRSWEDRGPGTDPGVLYVGVTTPHAACCIPASDEWRFADPAAISLVEGIFYRQAGISRLRGSDAIVHALLGWELERLELSVPDDPLAVQGRRVIAPDMFEALWEADTDYDDPGSRFRAHAAELGARMLVDLIVQRYGEAAYPQLVAWLGEANSLPHWLKLSLGLNDDEIAALEAEWAARYTESLVEMGYETGAQP